MELERGEKGISNKAFSNVLARGFVRNLRNMLRGLAFFVVAPHPAFMGSRMMEEEGDREGFGAKDGGEYIEFPKSALGFSGKDDTSGLLAPNELATLNQAAP